MHENTKIFRNLRNCAKSSISLNYLILIVVLDVNTVSNKVSTVTIFSIVHQQRILKITMIWQYFDGESINTN